MNCQRIPLRNQAGLRVCRQYLPHTLHKPVPLLRKQDYISYTYIPEARAIQNEFLAGIHCRQHARSARDKVHLSSSAQQLFRKREWHTFKNAFVVVAPHVFPSESF
jgi:hypothetical protein